ncbi:KH domain-containing protein At4g18375-like isoform X2 [Tasmannia lanceolata]|uniref:KH domain-containing protein At4g18375-like isoform X2 n=1 Tax=Tasmannia lanceolata TaxID=3420 RepID=UPI004063598F
MVRSKSRKRSHSQFNSRWNNGKGKRHNFTNEHSNATPKAIDTVYRILCNVNKIGAVIGKGGSVINALRDETMAKIKVADVIPGANERVVIIFSSPTRKPRPYNINQEDLGEDDLTEKDNEVMEPHCSAQDALFKIHERIAMEEDEYNENGNVVTARLLVPSIQVGCLLGKGGSVIQKVRSETGANIRVMAAPLLPSGAMSTDEIVQISGTPAVAKKALYEVSTLLHQNPRKDGPPLNNPGLYPSGASIAPMHAQGNPMWYHQDASAHVAPSMQWSGGYGSEPSIFVGGGFNGLPAGNYGDAAGEFSMKILCSTERIGGVIGKGGCNVKQLQNETGASINVQDIIPDADERVIVVSSTEALRDPRSPTVEAVLQLQSKTSEVSEKGIVTTRLLVESSKVGCLLGQSGNIITEMRRRTQADIRVYKDDKPNLASANEELVQISGNMGVSRDALLEIASRLRARSLRGANTSANPRSVGPFQGLMPSESFPGRGLPSSGMVGSHSSGGSDHMKGGGHDYGAQGYPIQPTATGYPNMNSFTEVQIPNSSVASVLGTGGSNISNIGQVSGATVKLNDPLSGASECIVQIRGSTEHMNTAQHLLQTFIASGGATQQVPPQF